MLALYLLPILIFTVAAVLFRSRTSSRSRGLIRAADENSLWVGLAAGLFDSADCPVDSRIEIALGAIARRLKARAGLVTVGGRSGRRVVACTSLDSTLQAGLERGRMLPRDSIYCGSVGEAGQLLTINYASLSEWRNHSACRELGWESYVGLSCGSDAGGNIVVCFFDTLPREQLFSRSELALVEQLGPWIAAMVAREDFTDASKGGIVYPELANTASGDA